MNTAKKQSVVIVNNDIVYLWWQVPRKIKKCLGFSIHRIVNGVEEKKGLYATVGFDASKDKGKESQTTDEWPIQSFNWKDVYAPHNKDLKYKIIPMIGTAGHLKPDKKNIITTETVRRSQDYGDLKVIFNRGILSTQAFSKALKKQKMTAERARKLISDTKGVWRKRLGGQMLYNVYSFFNVGSKAGGKYYAALYELTDEKLIGELTRNKGTEIILSNANKSKKEIVDGKEKMVTINDGTNSDTRGKLHKMKNIAVYDRMLGSHIGHNKFVIYADKSGKPVSVLTGSTNWTPTGICGQTNNMVIVNSPKIAAMYMKYWEEIKKDIKYKQGAEFRKWCAKNGCSEKINNGKVNFNLMFSPNTKQATKPAKNPPVPVDMKTVFELINKAKSTVLFLLFNPGTPSIIDQIRKTAEARQETKPLFVRGAVSDVKTAKSVTTNIFSDDIKKKPDTYYFDRITGVAAIPGSFSYFEQELLKIGFATIHDKILVIDPFDDDCVVVSGSHNLGYSASYKNDENMFIIQYDKAVARAYSAHVLDAVNHFKWRYKLQNKILKAKAKTKEQKEKVLKETWNDLDESDNWMDYYFNKAGFVNRDKFIFD